MMFKKNTLLSLLAVSVLALTACGTNGDTDPDTTMPAVEEQEDTSADDATTDETTDETDVAVETPEADDVMNLTLQPEEAFDIYQDKYPNATITQIQLDKDMGSYVYKVEGFEGNKEFELKIDPMDGTILKEDTEMDDDMDDLAITREQVTKVMALVEQAIADGGEGARIEEWTLDMDDGIAKLGVELDKKGMDDQERTYNVDTGDLIEIDN